MAIIYHITSKKEWEASQKIGQHQVASLIDEGLIHCSEEIQIPGVLERFFVGQSDLLKLTIDSEKLTSPLIYDWSPTVMDTFPHIYGPINLDAVIAVESLSNPA